MRLAGCQALYDGRNFSLGYGRERHDSRLRIRDAEIARPTTLDLEGKPLFLGQVATLDIIERNGQAVLSRAQLSPSERVADQ